MATLDQVTHKVENFFALRIGEKVILEFNGEVKLCMDILTPGGVKIAKDCIEFLSRHGTEDDDFRIISAEIGTPSEAMLQ